MHQHLPYICLFLLVLFATGSKAQEASKPADSLGVWTINLEGVTLSGAANSRQNRFSLLEGNDPTPRLRVGVNLVQREANVNLAGVLDRLPGIQMQQGSFNTNRLNVRGAGARSPFATNRFTLYYGEIPLTNGAGETAVEEWDPNLVGPADVWRGPAPSQLGAGVGGALKINIASDSPYPIALKSVGGSFGLFQNTVYLSPFKSATGTSPLKISFSRTHGDGYRQNNRYDRTSTLVAGTPLQKTKMVEPDTGSTTSRKITTRRLDYLLYAQRIKAFIPSSLNATVFAESPESAAANWFSVRGGEAAWTFMGGVTQHFGWMTRAGKEIRTKITAFGQSRTNDEIRPRPLTILTENNLAGGLRFVLEFNPEGQPGWIKTIGLEGYRERYRQTNHESLDMGAIGPFLFRITEQRWQYFLFAEGRVPVRKVDIEWGLNLKQTGNTWNFSAAPEDYLSAGSEPILSPRLAMRWFFDKKHLTEGFALFSSGAFWPGSESSFANGIRLDLLPERAWNLESGIRLPGLSPHGLEAEITAYRMEINNLLVPRELLSGEPVMVNAGKSLHQGIELLIGKTWIRQNPELHTRLTYTTGEFKFLNYIGTTGNFKGNQLAGVAPVRAHASVDLETRQGYYLHANYDFTDRMFANDANTVFSESFGLLSFRAGWQKVLTNPRRTYYLHCNLFAGLENLADIRYASMLQVNAAGMVPRYFYPGLPRHFYLGASFRFHH